MTQEQQKKQRKYLASKDFSLFFAYYFTEYIKFPFAPFHFEMFQDLKDLMAGKYREVAWIMFRESAKTSIAKAFIVWLICYKKRMYINVDSFDKENAERTLFDIVLYFQTNGKIVSDFGELFNAKRNPEEIQQKRVNNFVTNNGIRVEAHSTQESVRGRIHGAVRPDFLLLDDFETNKTKDSLAYTSQVIGHIDEFKSGLDATARILYLGNYITENGSVSSLMKRAKTDSRLLIRNVPVMIGDKTAWPEKYALTNEEATQRNAGITDEKRMVVSLEDKKIQLGSEVFSREMLNEPIDESTQVFFRKNFKYITHEEVEKKRTRKFATIDTALSKGKKDDFTGVTRNYVDEANNWNLSSKRYRIDPKELINLIFKLHDEDFEAIGIEETAYTEAIEPFFLDECEKRNKYPNVVKLKHGGIMKETRIRGLIPRYEAGKIFHIQNECNDLEIELLRFPKSTHDDCADATQYQNKIAEAAYPETIIQEEKEEEPLYPDIGI